ncbi:hypothetical protein D3C81_519930 [compost metagenome]
MLNKIGTTSYTLALIFLISGGIFFIFTPELVSKILVSTFFFFAALSFALLGNLFFKMSRQESQRELSRALDEYYRTRKNEP